MIKFGTDGWRAVIGDQFTYGNVRKVARAHAEVLKKRGLGKVVVGYDWRFSSEHFAAQIYDVFRAEGIEAKLVERACTTPMVSFAVKYMGFENGVMVTASHNPPNYNGYKVKESFGGSATPEFIAEIERGIENSSDEPAPKSEPETLEVESKYLSKVRGEISLELFRERGLKVVHDAMYGTSSGLLSRALEDTRAQVTPIRSYRDALFGGHAPEPVEKNLALLKEKVRAEGADVGVANDGDGDRIALVDERGEYVNTQLIYVLLLLHLIKHKNMREGIVVKTVSTTYLADRICRAEGIELREVPVGFKNINELILKEKVIFGGEESGGYGIPSYLPERDGLMSALFVLELMLLKGRPLSEIIEEVFDTYGRAYYKRVDFPADEGIKAKLKSLIERPPSAVGGRSVRRAITIDGLKLVFEDESWLLFRASGTEPLIRVYAEAPSQEELEELTEAGISLISV
ncbi:phosphoglucomutase/phosphomannomutase family protein [Hydrogenivirga sp. 128-5-R1-1]|uniref:phosphoglucomutase/phosphomannomutase family protein n=1 Tax=Hydrogenivirga sp. 128-5-R1-1 TaxID=392423 RepID=UPI00015F3898|nr:phosphoglucomutase/phosphomannomutase family protein [Hydrogenivirga sp. 128-5-R1-1]EDP76512.1 phosphoglucomutase/phosphomannomutase [Hydrogenivirga sp. 128-5-R1-1]